MSEQEIEVLVSALVSAKAAILNLIEKLPPYLASVYQKDLDEINAALDATRQTRHPWLAKTEAK